MKTFTIECPEKGKWQVVSYERGWLLKKRTELDIHSRLELAEMSLAVHVEVEFLRKLDERYYEQKFYDRSHIEPRAHEETLYTALVLANFPPAKENELWRGDDKKEAIIEARMGKLSMLERRLFEGRYMTWFAANNPEWRDPRRSGFYNDGPEFAPSNAVGGPTAVRKPYSVRTAQRIRSFMRRLALGMK